MLVHTTVFRLLSVVWHVCSSYPHNSPMSRHLAAQTAGVDHTVRGHGFPIKSYFPLAGCDPEGSQTKLFQKQTYAQPTSIQHSFRNYRFLRYTRNQTYLRNPNFYYRIHKCLPHDLILSLNNPFHASPAHFF